MKNISIITKIININRLIAAIMVTTKNKFSLKRKTLKNIEMSYFKINVFPKVLLT